MKLTKTQIQFIDNYLIEQGVKYWDVRIELIDHVASKLEEQEVQIELNRVFLLKSIGTKLTLEKHVEIKHKNVQKKYKRLYYNEFLNFFKNTKNVLAAVVILLLYYLSYSFLTYKNFKYVALFVFVFPMVISLFFNTKNFFKQQKSLHLEHALHYVYLSGGILQMFFQLHPNGIFEVTVQTQQKMLLIVPPLNALLTYCGYLVFKKAFNEYQKIYKQLQQL